MTVDPGSDGLHFLPKNVLDAGWRSSRELKIFQHQKTTAFYGVPLVSNMEAVSEVALYSCYLILCKLTVLKSFLWFQLLLSASTSFTERAGSGD